MISLLSAAHTGHYTCKAANHWAQASHSAALAVSGTPTCYNNHHHQWDPLPSPPTTTTTKQQLHSSTTKTTSTTNDHFFFLCSFLPGVEVPVLV
ncbi:hypothetical protein Pcinc_023029 [Petrolisthes cinctipes]|uniref:Uncharacterized protein n=1 Tax=Petrolisthes cinctipes TaxID=88211 RepID=A0AAE1KGA2_PETCI|nr:hypothetical protein Pcinc_023029 [Petrolisthes cinctipes]